MQVFEKMKKKEPTRKCEWIGVGEKYNSKSPFNSTDITVFSFLNRRKKLYGNIKTTLVSKAPFHDQKKIEFEIH